MRPWVAAAAVGEWLASRSTGFDSGLALATNDAGGIGVTALRPFDEGETLFELLHTSLLTPEAAYADREVGRDLQAYADRFGPGFGTVALSAFVALERVRNFQGATWFAGSSGAAAASEWSPITRTHWELEAARPSRIRDPDLVRAVTQGTQLVLPHIELAARRATPTDGEGGEGWSQSEVRAAVETAFGLVLSRQFARPPARLTAVPPAADPEDDDDDEARWGFETGAPCGPALLLPLDGVLLATDAEAANAALGLPPRPRLGNLGAGVGLRCVATRPIDTGEALLVDSIGL